MKELRKISREELNNILELHKKWLNNEEGGEKADLSYTDLRGVDLSYANLTCANLIDANLDCAILKGTNLKGANLEYANLTCADLKDTDLECVNLTGANLVNVVFSSDFSIKESGVDFDFTTSFLSLQCPEEGSFVGFKRSGDKIVKLLIMEDSLRSSATTRKCRASHVKVLDITNIEGTEHYTECENTENYEQKYVVEKEIFIDNFDKNRWAGCSTGIHFFITRQEAVLYF